MPPMTTFPGTAADRAPDGQVRFPRIFSDPALDAAFWEDGFTLQPLLDHAAIDDLAGQFAQLRPSDRFDPSTDPNATATYHCTFLDRDRGYRRAADELVREVFADRLRAVLPSYEILTSNIYVKPPGTGRFAIHQNWPTIEDLDVPTLTAWVPLQDTSFANGGIRLVRGSHHVFPDIAAATSDRFFDDFATELIENYLEPVPVAGGELLLFDDSLLHWSGANRSSSPRVTFQIELIPTEAPGVLWIRDQDEPDWFDLWAVDKEYWIEYPFESVFGRPEGLSHVGRRRNPNRRITFEEFEDAMARQHELRRARYSAA
jgi:hypothetical protein